MKIIFISPFFRSFYEDFLMPQTIFLFVSYPCNMQPRPNPSPSMIQLRQTKQNIRVASFTIWVSQHIQYNQHQSIQNINLLCSVPWPQKRSSCLQFQECKLHRHPVCLFVIRNHSFPSCLHWFMQIWPPTCFAKAGSSWWWWCRQMSQEINLILLHPLLHS